MWVCSYHEAVTNFDTVHLEIVSDPRGHGFCLLSFPATTSEASGWGSGRLAVDRRFQRPLPCVRLMCWSGSKNSGKHFIYDINSYYRRIHLRISHLKKRVGQSVWIGAQSFPVWFRHATHPESPCVHQPGAL